MLNAEQELIGAIFCESTFEGYFDSAGGKSEVLPARRVTEWVSTYAGRSLMAARDYETLPFVPVMRRIRDHAAFAHREEAPSRALEGRASWAASLLLILLWPAKNHVDGDCAIQALHRAMVVPEITARIENVLRARGRPRRAGQMLAQLDMHRLQLELESTAQEEASLPGGCGPRERARGRGGRAGFAAGGERAEPAGEEAASGYR